MSIFKKILAPVAVASMLAGTGLANAATEVNWWHAMGGALGEKVDDIAKTFNESQSDVVVAPVYKGTYAETMTAAIAAFRAGEQPQIVQVFEVGTGTMMAAEGAVYPVYKLMEDNGKEFDPADYLASVVGYYTDADGNMLSFPFNSSTPILYYNKDIFEAAGLDADTAPATWADVEAASEAILAADAAKCGFTTRWPSWVQIENFSAWHNIPIGTKENGFGGLDAEFAFNNEQVARHMDNLAKWQKSGVFSWAGGGAGPDAGPKLYSGECAMMMESSAGLAGVLANSDFTLGIGMLPYYDDIEGAPQNTIIGGASLWVLQGHEPEEYAATAAFFEYLSSAEVQADWHQFSGYLPITHGAYELGIEQGYYEKNPGRDISIKQMTLNTPTANSKGLRFGNFVQVRDVISEEMEQIMSGDKTGQEALDSAVERGNQMLRDFEASNK
jgi:sn-glycerol 3-phosphate transport system substrate-binding protein